MNIAIFGLGYVGTVSMACFARNGHHVVGVDINRQKVDIIQQGRSPIIEPGLEELLKSGINSHRIEVTQDTSYALQDAEVVIITVGTPSKKNGGLDTQYVERVCHDIGNELAKKNGYVVVVIRSTVLPGSAVDIFIPILEETSKKQVGRDYGFCINPEFLREGMAVKDFDNPPYTVIGQYDERSGNILAKLYGNMKSPVFQVSLGTAEMVKYASNAFHAVKVVFANEIGNICKAYGVDSHQVMDIFVKDVQLNLSPYYLKPGFSFGGSCLGKDVRALLFSAHQRDVQTPLLESIMPSNYQQIEKAVEMLVMTGKRKIGMLGLSFKPNTDDLRESPALELAERLIGKGFELSVYDREVSLSQIYGSNKEYMEKSLPHIGTLMKSDLQETVLASDVILVTKKLSQEENETLLSTLTSKHIIIDLVRIDGNVESTLVRDYRGICW